MTKKEKSESQQLYATKTKALVTDETGKKWASILVTEEDVIIKSEIKIDLKTEVVDTNVTNDDELRRYTAQALFYVVENSKHRNSIDDSNWLNDD